MTKKSREQLQQMVAASLEQLTRLTDEARIGEQMQRYLTCMGRFNAYSPNNVLLIFSQCSHARHVAGYKRWQRMGFQVRRGEKGIGILAPRPYRKREVEVVADDIIGKPETEEMGVWFKTVYVFDISQVGIPCFVCGGALSSPEATHCETCGDELEVSLLFPGVVEGKDINKVTAQVHEVMRSMCERLDIPRSVRETEAEAVAYAVCTHFGLDPVEPVEAVNYVALWDHDGAVLRDRMERIAAAARQVIAGLVEPEVTLC